jgi:uncharacterized protein YacL
MTNVKHDYEALLKYDLENELSKKNVVYVTQQASGDPIMDAITNMNIDQAYELFKKIAYDDTVNNRGIFLSILRIFIGVTVAVLSSIFVFAIAVPLFGWIGILIGILLLYFIAKGMMKYIDKLFSGIKETKLRAKYWDVLHPNK